MVLSSSYQLWFESPPSEASEYDGFFQLIEDSYSPSVRKLIAGLYFLNYTNSKNENSLKKPTSLKMIKFWECIQTRVVDPLLQQQQQQQQSPQQQINRVEPQTCEVSFLDCSEEERRSHFTSRFVFKLFLNAFGQSLCFIIPTGQTCSVG